MNQAIRYVVPLTLTLTFSLTLPASDAAASRSTGLTRAQSCSAVRNRLVDVLTDQAMRSWRYRWRRRVHRRKFRPAPMPSAAAKAARSAPRAADSAGAGASREASRGPSHFTGTNNQVDGVDEADRVKTDGRSIYRIYGKQVLIVRSWPVKVTRIIGRYTVKAGFTPRSLFLKGNKLMVISSGYRRYSPKGQMPKWWTRRNKTHTRVTLLDISNRTAPRRLAAVEITGNALKARMIGTNAYLVSNDAINMPHRFWQTVRSKQQASQQVSNFRPWGAPARPQQVHQAGLRQAVRATLSNVPIAALLPTIQFFDSNDRPIAKRSLHRCSDLYVPNGAARAGLLSLTKLSLAGGRVHTAGVMAGGQKVYASRKNLYVSTTAYRYHWSRRWGYNGTQIHKFSLAGVAPRYQASGVVSGYLLNQFSMDEHRGYLRVATTSRGWGWRRGARGGNNLFVLRQSGHQLRVTGHVRGLAPGERIYAARMMGDKGYIVTFRRTDPLYTLDLSNPRRPRVMGELKINGFSSYIHPLAPGLLLTVGQDATSSGRVRGAHLQIFDVRNLKQPTRTHHYLLTEGYRSSSSAQYDHHAFTFDRRSGTLALPLRVNSRNRWTGMVLVKVSPQKGFKYVGTIDHTGLAHRSSAGPVRYRCASNTRCRPHYVRRAWVPIDRSIFIDRYVFTLSNLGVAAHDLGQGTPRQVLAIRYDQRQPKRPHLSARPWH
jgi:uncharacterized secreted protein with C-terminal beta-propeller domain